MPLEVIYVVRHGFRSGWSVDPITGVYTAAIPSPTGLPADPALTSYGVDQARELGSHLMTLDPPIDAVYSSPYYRCLQTIAPFVELRRQEQEQQQQRQRRDGPAATGTSQDPATSIRPEYGLCEFFGAAPFDHPVPASPATLKSMFPAYDEDHVSALAPSRRGERIEDLYRRVAAAVQAIIARCDADGTRAVVLCTHAAVIIALGRVLTGRIPESIDTHDFQAFTCGLSVYQRQVGESGPPPGSGTTLAGEVILDSAWECDLDGDCSFLSGGQERGWKFAGDESFPGTGSMSQADADPKL